MVFVGAAILPHGGMIFDGDPNSPIPQCRERNSSMPPDVVQKCSLLYNACERAADLVAKMNPDIVLLITPHGLELLSGAYAVYMSNAAQAKMDWIEVNISLEYKLSEQFLEFVQKQGLKADGILTFTGSEAPLQWGEGIPLWFLNKKLDSEKVKYIIVSCGYWGERFEDFGRTLHDFASTLQQRLAVVISADLAHTHKTDCTVPLYLPDPSWTGLKPTDIAEEFDRTCQMWARGIPHGEDTRKGLGKFEEAHPWIANKCLPWLQKIVENGPEAKTCGRGGFQILHGVLEKENEAGGSITSHFLARCAPSYFGMMIVVFDVSWPNQEKVGD